MELELTYCPACGRPAEVFDRFVVFGERGPMEHEMIRCVTGPTYERHVGRWIPGGRSRRNGDGGARPERP